MLLAGLLCFDHVTNTLALQKARKLSTDASTSSIVIFITVNLVVLPVPVANDRKRRAIRAFTGLLSLILISIDLVMQGYGLPRYLAIVVTALKYVNPYYDPATAGRLGDEERDNTGDSIEPLAELDTPVREKAGYAGPRKY